MTDLVTTARTARERLAAGLNALQNPALPEGLQSAAEPIAMAMSALHQIERSGALPVSAVGPNVLDLVRQALAKLQSEHSDHPSLTVAMEAVAGSLGLVFGLVQRMSSAPPAPNPTSSSPQPVVASPAVAAAPRVAPVQSVATSQQQVGGASIASLARPKSTSNRPPAAPAVQTQQPNVAQAASDLAPAEQGTMVSRQSPILSQSTSTTEQAAPAAPKPAAAQSPLATAQTMVAAPSPAAPAVAAVAHAPAVPATHASVDATGAPLQRISAELGAHSATNFYKGLGGNDVVDSGGIFVATYQVPEVGKNLLIRVSLPGGYEFEAKGVVRWTREPSPMSRGEDISPGFGAQFTEISPEARQLVYRYARNREPLFHDDL
jgi:hypothetical protein